MVGVYVVCWCVLFVCRVCPFVVLCQVYSLVDCCLAVCCVMWVACLSLVVGCRLLSVGWGLMVVV